MSEKRIVIFSNRFPRILKALSKKYRHVEEDVDDFADTLEQGETPGDRLQGTGDYIVYKARVASRDMQRGKSGGFRAIYYLKTEDYIIILTVYAKTEQLDISTAEILEIISEELSSTNDQEESN
jgi:mRNA-degrading endonuclease RelE of RelBE toxin-antitoxin system